MLRAVAKEEASSLQWWSVSNVFSTFIRSDKRVWRLRLDVGDLILWN